MNRDYIANMIFNINDVVETIQGHSINDDIIKEYDQSQFDKEPKTLMDIPKDREGSAITIGECLLDLQTHINELHNYFSKEVVEITDDNGQVHVFDTFRDLIEYADTCGVMGWLPDGYTWRFREGDE